ncbi:MAG TPA: MFS transporter [Candidatus Limnocylindrales bacterium]|nr:MFS transporter [Candidatus Limnocylindrales bacterium]
MTTFTPDPRRWWALAIIAIAQFMVIMDTSIIGVALPEIQRALGISPANLSWVFNAYVVAFGGLLLLGGRLADLYGARRVFIAGFVILTSASLLTGLAPTEGILLAGRALQGVGAALIAPAALTLLMTLFAHDSRELTKALALYGAAAPAGGTAGVFLGGLLTSALDWRWVFLVNIPIGLLVLLASRSVLPAIGRRSGRLDLAGAVAVTAALSLAVFGIVRAPAVGWTSLETIVSLLGAAVLLAAFVRIESTKPEPLMRLGIWRAPNLAAANVAMALLGAAWIPAWFFLNLYLQQVLGFGPFEGGLALVPTTVAIMVLMVGVTGRIVGRFGFKLPLVAGLLLLAAGIGWLSFAPADGSYLANVLPASLLAAVGMSLAYIPAMLAALSGARPEEAGLASGIVNTTYQVGSALGLAVITAVATAAGFGTGGDVAGFPAAFLGAAAVAIVAAGAVAVTLKAPGAAEPRVDVPAARTSESRSGA